MEGINFLAFLIWLLAIIFVGVLGFIILSLLYVGRRSDALKVYATGFFVVTGLGALAQLSYVVIGSSVNNSLTDWETILMSLSLIMAGLGQYIATGRRVLFYKLAIGCSVSSGALLVSTLVLPIAVNELSLIVVSLVLGTISIIISLFSVEGTPENSTTGNGKWLSRSQERSLITIILVAVAIVAFVLLVIHVLDIWRSRMPEKQQPAIQRSAHSNVNL